MLFADETYKKDCENKIAYTANTKIYTNIPTNINTFILSCTKDDLKNNLDLSKDIICIEIGKDTGNNRLYKVIKEVTTE